MEIGIDKKDLYGMIKKAVREVLHEETFEFFLKSIPTVSKEEMEDIEKVYDKPTTDKRPAFS